MQSHALEEQRKSPAGLIDGLVRRLRNHVLWDSLLLTVPPVIAAMYLILHLYQAAWLTRPEFVLVSVAVVAVGMLALALHYRPRLPSVRSTAQLVDQKTEAKDRFVTLVTLEPSTCAASLLERLRREAAGFERRIQVTRDFPYQVKHSFYWSLIVSIFAAALLPLLVPVMRAVVMPVPAYEQVRQLAAKFAQRPRLTVLAADLQTLAVKLEDRQTPAQEKQQRIQELEKKIAQQQKQEEQKEDRDLLGQASSTLQGLEQQSGNGQDQKKNQDKGGGGIQSNLPQEGQGEGKQSQGSGGDSKGDLNAQLSNQMEQGKSAQGDPKDQGKEKNPQGKGDGKGNQPDANKSDASKPDSNKPDPAKGRESAGKDPGGAEEKSGKTKNPEEIPQGAPPTDRFYQPGEQGKAGLKGAGYVTVQLPEEISEEGKGERTGTKEVKGARPRSKLPVSNAPLPANVPDAPMEKQQMPLEYRGIIR
jgi:hypothetical protein